MTKSLKCIAAVVAFCLCPLPVIAGENATDTAKLPSPWKKGLTTEVGFSQMSLTNWSAGGQGSISLNTYLDGYANYRKGRLIWDSEMQLGYGFIQHFDGTKLKKSDDRIIIDSKVGYEATRKLFVSALFNFRSQFARGYNYDKTDDTGDYLLTSQAFAPAYITLGLGVDYQPWNWLSVNFAPVTGKATIVGIPWLRDSYGNAADQACRIDLGAQLKVNAKVEVKNFKVASDMTFFSNYLDHPLDIKVNWDLNVEAKISNYFAVTLRTNLIYDSKIKSKILRDSEGEPVVGPDGKDVMVAGVQFKELFSVGFAYTFGTAKE